MPDIVGVRFHGMGKAYHFELGDLDVESGDAVIVETDKGIELGFATSAGRFVKEEHLREDTKPVLRLATDEDLERYEGHLLIEQEAYEVGKEQIRQHKLDMNLVEVNLTFDESRLIFYFTSEKRVDFRNLVRDLAAIFHRRIELRQIWVREQARMCGGVGVCGRELCCSSWMDDFVPVSVKMAKTQNISMNPNNISGQCGRLLCCLNYEQEQYEAAKKIAPRVGKEVGTPRGRAIVRRVELLPEQAQVKIVGDESDDVYLYNFDELDYPHPPRQESLGCAGCSARKEQGKDDRGGSQRRRGEGSQQDAGTAVKQNQAEGQDQAAAGEQAAKPKRRRRKPRRVGKPAEPGFIPRPLTPEEVEALKQQAEGGTAGGDEA